MVQPYLHESFSLALADVKATQQLGTVLAQVCCAGDLIRLEGDLGAGKTTLVQAFLQALGVGGEIPSPTYTLLQTYRTTRFMVAHLDCYRLTSPAELVPLGLEEMRRFGVVLAEWPARGGALLAPGGDLLPYHVNSIENPGVLTVRLQAPAAGGRTAVLTGPPSWQRRFSLLPKLGLNVPVPVTRGQTAAGQHAFLKGLGLKNYTLEPRAGDFSARSYARVRLPDGTSRMLMDAPPPIESVREYAEVAAYYRHLGLRAAEVLGRDDAQGYLLTEDFGNTTLWDAMQQGPQTPWFRVAAEALAVQCKAPPPAWAKVYNRTDWWVEAARFINWYVPFATGQAATLEDVAAWQALVMPLYDVVDATPRGLMMWDCQSPNLMLTGAEPKLENLALIDLQDARVAPVAQDVGLLVRNIRTPRRDADEEAVVATLVARLGGDELTLRRGLAVGALHHMLRILGGLTRLAVRDGRPGPAQAYLHRAWEVAEHCLADPLGRDMLAPLGAFMAPYKELGLQRLGQLRQGA